MLAAAAHVNSNRDGFRNCVTFTFWPLGQCMPSDYYRACVPSLVLIAEAVFLLECR